MSAARGARGARRGGDMLCTLLPGSYAERCASGVQTDVRQGVQKKRSELNSYLRTPPRERDDAPRAGSGVAPTAARARREGRRP